VERQVVVIFPQARLEGVEAFRTQWDPLSSSIPALITLVFPVSQPRPQAALARELTLILADFAPFAVTLPEIRAWEQEYLFLVADQDREEITRLHAALYDGPFGRAARLATFLPPISAVPGGQFGFPRSAKPGLDPTSRKDKPMMLILGILLLALILGGLGSVVHVLWRIALVVLAVWLAGFLFRSAGTAGGRGRWYRW
jgi:hypothetical protein